MTTEKPLPTAEKTVDFSIMQDGVPCIGRPQIAQDYSLHPSKVHRLLNESGIAPVLFINRHFYPEPAVRAYFAGLQIKQVSRAAKRTK
jgi:hypothetical protein